jgi:hypothetical protein
MTRRASSGWMGMNTHNVKMIRFGANEVAAIHAARRSGRTYKQLSNDFNACTRMIQRVLDYHGVYQQYRNRDAE